MQEKQNIPDLLLEILWQSDDPLDFKQLIRKVSVRRNDVSKTTLASVVNALTGTPLGGLIKKSRMDGRPPTWHLLPVARQVPVDQLKYLRFNRNRDVIVPKIVAGYPQLTPFLKAFLPTGNSFPAAGTLRVNNDRNLERPAAAGG